MSKITECKTCKKPRIQQNNNTITEIESPKLQNAGNRPRIEPCIYYVVLMANSYIMGSRQFIFEDGDVAS